MARHRCLVSAAFLAAGLSCLSVFAGRAEAHEPLLAADGGAVVFAEDVDRGGPATRENERRNANANDWFRAPVRNDAGGGVGGGLDFPSAEVHEAVVANAEAAAARAVFRRAESGLAAAVRVAQKSAESSADLREAMAAEQRAYENYQAVRQNALRDVVADDKYKAMQDLRENLSRQIADRRESADEAYERSADRAARVRLASAGPVAGPGEPQGVMAMASLKLRVGSDARAMERDALANNEQVRKAQQDYVAASAKVTALRAEADKKIREDAAVTTARASLEDARINRVVAETYFRGADLAAGTALDFAYNAHRWDYARYSHYYDGYSYPYASFGLRYGYGYASRAPRSIP